MQGWQKKSDWIKILGIASLLSLGVFATVWYLRAPCPHAYDSYRQVLADHHKRLARSIGPYSHVFLGASTMQGLDASQVALNAINLSIGSETLTALSLRVQHYPQVRQAAAAYLLAGYNDLCSLGEARTLAALASTLDFIGAGPDVYVIGLQSVLGQGECVGINEQIKRHNLAAQQLCAQRANCRFYDPNPSLMGHNGLPAPEYYEADGLHLSGQGYRVLVGGLKSVSAAH